LLPDEGSTSGDPEGARSSRGVLIMDGWPLRTTLRTKIFWAIAAAQNAANLFWAGFNFHVIDILKLQGVSEHDAALIYVPISVVSVFVSLLLGFRIDQITNKSRVLGVGTLAASGCAVSLLLVRNQATAFLFSILFGVWKGICDSVNGILLADLFGRRCLGSIQAFSTGLTTVSAGLGPLIFGIARDYLSSYHVVLITLVGLTGCAGCLLCVISPPSRSPHFDIPIREGMEMGEEVTITEREDESLTQDSA